ncbi:MAG: hypothetical protein KAV87_50640 [Desulfobacteraceae bacterium]|nr:hypothetical protein [Desulfobacteraceae bacterium]
MSIGLFIKQKNLIKLELRKKDVDYELIYRKAKEKQFKKEKNYGKNKERCKDRNRAL